MLRSPAPGRPAGPAHRLGARPRGGEPGYRAVFDLVARAADGDRPPEGIRTVALPAVQHCHRSSLQLLAGLAARDRGTPRP